MNDTPNRGSRLPPALLAVLREQQQHWQDGDRVTAEELLRRHPDLAAAPDAALELVYNEAILREQAGEAVDLADLQRRFPDLASALAVQWRVDRALVSGLSLATASTIPSETKPVSPTPSHVGRYRIDGLLGTGGMGVVYLAWDDDLRRTLAVKMLKGGWPSDDALARFRTEAAVVAQLNHPHVVPVFDTGECDGRPFYGMEYCAGGTLADRLKSGPLPAAAAAEVLVQVARGVAAAHAHGVLHRDLKPGNVLLTAASAAEMPVYKVADFGLAKDLTDGTRQTHSGAIVGTPNYMPPEQAFGPSKDLKPTADVYSLGAILYECLTGRPPFQGATVAETLNQVRAAEPVPVRRLQATVPRDLETICQKCLHKEPGRRYTTVGDLADDLARFQDGRPILARPVGSLERGWRWAKRNRLAASLTAAVAVVVVAAAVGGTVMSLWLAAALADAKRDRDRATDSERQTREHLAASHAAAARLALQRGNGRVALQRLDEAAAAGLDTPALRFERVKALCTVHDLNPALDEVRRLAARDDLGDLAGEVLLWQADLELDTHGIDAETALRQIRQAIDRGLPEAQGHYARGLSAVTTGEAVGHYRRAVQADPANPRTTATLVLLLAFSGQPAEAHERLIAAKLLFPENPVFVVLHAILDAFGERPAAVKSHLAALRDLLPDGPYTTAQATVAFCQDFTGFIRDMEKVHCGDPSVNRFLSMLSFQQAILNTRATTARASKDFFLPFPPGLLQGLRDATRGFAGGLTLFLPGNQKALAAAYQRLAEAELDGFFFMMAGAQRTALRTADDWKAAESLFRRAADASSFLPIHRMSLYGGASAAAHLAAEGPEAERAEFRRRALDYMGRLSSSALLAEQGSKLTGQCERLDAPPELTWRVIAAWEQAAPADPRLPLCRAKCFLRSHAYEAVVRLADETGERKDNPEWQELRRQATAAWRRQSDEFFRPHPPGK